MDTVLNSLFFDLGLDSEMTLWSIAHMHNIPTEYDQHRKYLFRIGIAKESI